MSRSAGLATLQQRNTAPLKYGLPGRFLADDYVVESIESPKVNIQGGAVVCDGRRRGRSVQQKSRFPITVGMPMKTALENIIKEAAYNRKQRTPSIKVNKYIYIKGVEAGPPIKEIKAKQPTLSVMKQSVPEKPKKKAGRRSKKEPPVDKPIATACHLLVSETTPSAPAMASSSATVTRESSRTPTVISTPGPNGSLPSGRQTPSDTASSGYYSNENDDDVIPISGDYDHPCVFDVPSKNVSLPCELFPDSLLADHPSCSDAITHSVDFEPDNLPPIFRNDFVDDCFDTNSISFSKSIEKTLSNIRHDHDYTICLF